MRKQVTVLLVLVVFIGIARAEDNVISRSQAINLPGKSYIRKTRVENIEYRYLPLAEEPFFAREVKKFKQITDVVYGGVVNYHDESVIELDPGERIVDRLFNIGREGSFLFYSDDRSLVRLFKSIANSKADFDNAGRLVKMTIEGPLLKPCNCSWPPSPPSTMGRLTRSEFAYNAQGRIISYRADTNYYSPTNCPWGGVKIYQVIYDQNGRIIIFLYGDGTFGYWEKYLVYGIKYNLDGEIISCSAQFLGSY